MLTLSSLITGSNQEVHPFKRKIRILKSSKEVKWSEEEEEKLDNSQKGICPANVPHLWSCYIFPLFNP